ncbi:hypothetical protein LPJ55_003468 [Coemansia sp. RSA 990]|nr:hypothetical protein LPJ55_003468 [Coemansia sp. RSA 990]
MTNVDGTLGLTHSLMRSRVAWLTNAFGSLSEKDSQQPRVFVGAADIQIGPHLFDKTKFYRVNARIDSEASASKAMCPDTMLALAFADHPHTLFWLPLDLGIVQNTCRSNKLCLYFYAQPRKLATNRKPSIIKQDWPFYFAADKVLTRVGIQVHEPNSELVDEFVRYADSAEVRLCREYRQSLCQPQPTVKYWYAFFPQCRQVLKASLPPSASPNLKSPEYTTAVPASFNHKAVTAPMQPRLSLYHGTGGKSKSYKSLVIAAAKCKTLSEVTSDSSDSESEEQLPKTSKRARIK